MIETFENEGIFHKADLSRYGEDVVKVQNDDGAYIIETEIMGSGIKVLTDTTHFPDGVGHRLIYAKSLPPDSSLYMLPSNFVMSRDRISVSEAVRKVDCIYLLGGEDPGPVYTNDEDLAKTAGEYGGINELRDLTTKLMIEEALRQGKDIVADCAGFERLATYFQMKLVEIDSSYELVHRPSNPHSTKKPPVYHEVFPMRPDNKRIPELDEIFAVNSHHHLAVTLGGLNEEELFQKYGLVLYHGSHIGENKVSIESFYGKTPTGSRIFGIQGHPERDDSTQGELMRKFIQNFVTGNIDIPF